MPPKKNANKGSSSSGLRASNKKIKFLNEAGASQLVDTETGESVPVSAVVELNKEHKQNTKQESERVSREEDYKRRIDAEKYKPDEANTSEGAASAAYKKGVEVAEKQGTSTLNIHGRLATRNKEIQDLEGEIVKKEEELVKAPEEGKGKIKIAVSGMRGRLAVLKQELERLQKFVPGEAKVEEAKVEEAKVEEAKVEETTNSGTSNNIQGSIEKKKKEIEALEAEITEKEAQLKEKEEQLASLKKEVPGVQSGGGQVEDLEKEVNILKFDIERLKEKLATLKKELSELEAKVPTSVSTTLATQVNDDADAEMPQPTVLPCEKNSPRLRAKINADVRAKMSTNSTGPKPIGEYLHQRLNIFGDLYYLGTDSPIEDIRAAPKNLTRFLAEYGINPEYGVDVATIIKAFFVVFPDRSKAGLPRDAHPSEEEAKIMGLDAEGKLREKLCGTTQQKPITIASGPYDIAEDPAFQYICGYLNHRIFTLKAEMTLYNRNDLRRAELKRQADAINDLLKKGKCHKISENQAKAQFLGAMSASTATTTTTVAEIDPKLDFIIKLLRGVLGTFINCDEIERIKGQLADGQVPNIQTMLSMLYATRGNACKPKVAAAAATSPPNCAEMKAKIDELRGVANAIGAKANIPVIDDKKPLLEEIARLKAQLAAAAPVDTKEYEAKIKELTDAAAAAAADCKEKIEALEAERAALEEQVKGLNEEIERLRGEQEEGLEGKIKQIAELEAQVAELNGQVEELKAQNAELAEKLAACEAEKEELRKQLEDQTELNAKIAEQAATIERLNMRIADLEGQLEAATGTESEKLATLRLLLDEANEANGRLREEIRAANEARDAALAEVEGLKDQVAALQEELRIAKLGAAGNEELMEEIRRLTAQLGDKESLIQKKDAEIEALKTALSEAQAQGTNADDLRRQIGELLEQLAAAQNALAEAQSQGTNADELRQQVEQLGAALAEAQAKLAAADELSKKVAELEAALAAAENEMDDLREWAQYGRDIQPYYENQEKELAALRQQLADALAAQAQGTQNQERIAELEAALADTDAKWRNSYSHWEAAAAELEENRAKLAALQKQLNDALAARAQGENNQKVILDLLRQLNELKKNLDESQRRLASKGQEAESKDQEVARLRAALEAVQRRGQMPDNKLLCRVLEIMNDRVENYRKYAPILIGAIENLFINAIKDINTLLRLIEDVSFLINVLNTTIENPTKYKKADNTYTFKFESTGKTQLKDYIYLLTVIRNLVIKTQFQGETPFVSAALDRTKYEEFINLEKNFFRVNQYTVPRYLLYIPPFINDSPQFIQSLKQSSSTGAIERVKYSNFVFNTNYKSTNIAELPSPEKYDNVIKNTLFFYVPDYKNSPVESGATQNESPWSSAYITGQTSIQTIYDIKTLHGTPTGNWPIASIPNVSRTLLEVVLHIAIRQFISISGLCA